MPTREGYWTEEELFQCAEKPWDADERMHHKTRVYQYPEIFGFFDPDMLAPSPAPPPEVQAALEDVMGDVATQKRDDGRPDLILRLHPWFKRWTLFARQSLKGRVAGEGVPAVAWQPVMVLCSEADPRAEYSNEFRPEDLKDKKYSEIWGRVGDYKLPDRRDFEDFREKCDRQFATVGERHQKFENDRLKASRAAEARQRDYERDLCDYGFAAYYRDLVRSIGGGQGLPFLPQTSLEAFAAERELRVPVTNEAGEILYYEKFSKEKLARAALDVLAAEERWREAIDEAGLSKVKLAAAHIAFGKELPRDLEPYADEEWLAAQLEARRTDRAVDSRDKVSEEPSKVPTSRNKQAAAQELK